MHERFVNLQTTGGVEDDDVAAIRVGKCQRLARDLQNIRLAALQKNRNANLFAKRFQLIHRRRAINVRRHEQRRAALFCQQFCQLAAGSGFAGAVQADHQHAARIAGKIQR